MNFKEQVLSSEEPHQEVLNIAYSHWQENTDWAYADMIENTENLYGELAAIAVLVGKYNQQVCNGGHSQYFDNGYSSMESRKASFSGHEEIELHKKMVKYLKENGFKNDPVIKAMDSFYMANQECPSCGGDGWFYEEEECPDTGDIEGIEESCYDCNGSGEDENSYYGEGRDKMYWDLSDSWMERFQKFLVDNL